MSPTFNPKTNSVMGINSGILLADRILQENESLFSKILCFNILELIMLQVTLSWLRNGALEHISFHMVTLWFSSKFICPFACNIFF